MIHLGSKLRLTRCFHQILLSKAVPPTRARTTTRLNFQRMVRDQAAATTRSGGFVRQMTLARICLTRIRTRATRKSSMLLGKAVITAGMGRRSIGVVCTLLPSLAGASRSAATADSTPRARRQPARSTSQTRSSSIGRSLPWVTTAQAFCRRANTSSVPLPWLQWLELGVDTRHLEKYGCYHCAIYYPLECHTSDKHI